MQLASSQFGTGLFYLPTPSTNLTGVPPAVVAKIAPTQIDYSATKPRSQSDFLIPVPEKSSRAGTWLTRDDGVLFILLQQIGRRAVGLATAEDLATVQAMLQVALGLFFRNLGLAYRRVLNQ